MTAVQQYEQVKYLGIEFSRAGIKKMAGARTDRQARKEDIQGICVKYGRPGERTWFQVIVGVILLGIAIYLLLDVLTWLFVTGGTRSFMSVGPVPFLVGIGGWLVWDAVKPQYYLEVTANTKTYKFAFERAPQAAKLKKFLELAAGLGYAVDTAALK